MFTMTELEAISPLGNLSTPNLQKLDGVQVSSLKEDFVEALGIAQKNISMSDWRWVPVPIEDWIMGEEYLNLRDSIRAIVFEDICSFFSTKDGDPWNRNYDEAIFSESIGCHARGTKILMYDRSLKPVEDIQVGDQIMGDDHTARTVLRIIAGREEMFEISPKNGDPFIVNKNHVLSLNRKNKWNNKFFGSSACDAIPINISVVEYIKQSKIFKNIFKLYQAPIDCKSYSFDGALLKKSFSIIEDFLIAPAGIGDYFGFELDGNHLYLTSDFIVHHNSGKSFKTSIIATYFEHLLLCLRNPQRFFGIDQTSKIAIVNTSVNERNARKIIFSEISQKILGCKWFREKPWGLPDARMPCPRLQSELKFKNNTFIIPGSSSWRTTVGYNIIFGVMDEAGAYREGKDTSIDYTEEMYNALQRRIGSRFEGKGGCVVAGSPLYEGDFIEQRLRDSRGDTRTMCRRRSIWESKYPNWKGEVFWSSFINRENYPSKPEGVEDAVAIPNIPFLWKAFNANPTKAWRDFGAKASSAIKPFFESNKCIFDCINKDRSKDPWKNGKFAEWFKPISKGPHFIHVDLGLTGDAAALCMSHPAGFNDEGALKVYVDLFMRWQGKQGNPVDLASIREYIYALRDMGFNISLITFDSFASEDMIQILTKKNFKVKRQSVDKDTVAYNNLKEVMREGRLDYYCIMRFLINEKGQGRGYNDIVRLGNDELTPSGIFVKECCQLEDIEGKKVDHPHGEKYSKDVADACAGSVNNVITNQTLVGKIRVRS